MKKVGKAIAILVIVSIAAVVIGKSCIKAYYMSHINCIDLPENVHIVKKEVSFSDVYGWHVLAEEIIETDLSWQDIRDIIDLSPYGKHILLFDIDHDYIEWDDYHLSYTDIDGKKRDGMNYFLINEHTPYGKLTLEE